MTRRHHLFALLKLSAIKHGFYLLLVLSRGFAAEEKRKLEARLAQMEEELEDERTQNELLSDKCRRLNMSVRCSCLNHLRDSFPVVVVVALHSSLFVVFIRVSDPLDRSRLAYYLRMLTVSSASAEGNGRSCFVAYPKTQSSNYVQNN